MITISNTQINQIAKLTDRNHHTEAVYRLCEIINNEELITIMKHVINIHEELGYMLPDVSELRRQCFNKAMKLVENTEEVLKGF